MNPNLLSWPTAFLLGVGSVVDMSGGAVGGTELLPASSTFGHSFRRVGGYLSGALVTDLKTQIDVSQLTNEDKHELELLGLICGE